MKDLEGFHERYPLNSRLVKRDGRLVEEPYRVGGKYGEQIGRIVGHLEAAAKRRAGDHARRPPGPGPVLQDGDGRGPGEVRHRLGPRQGLAGRYDQWIH